MPDLVLNNCRTEPWASYLRGLAVLRIVAEQKDPNARGRFQDDRFVLTSHLDRDGLLDFFIDEYRPTPVVSPWSGGSGFYSNDDKTAIERILYSEDPRFGLYSKTISIIRSWPEIPGSDRSIDRLLDDMENEVHIAYGVEPKEIVERYLSGASSLKGVLSTLGPSRSNLPLEDTISALAIREQLTKEGRWDTIGALPLEKLDRGSLPSGSNKLVANIKKIRTFLDSRTRSDNKEELLRKCRSLLPIEAVGWVDAVMIVGSDGKAKYPPILGGSGGNEGRLEYSRTFMSYVSDLLLSPSERGRSRELLANSLFGERTNKYSINTMGMFDPGRAGGFNQGVGIEAKDFPANPWDFVLAIEGSILWASSITRRSSEIPGALTSPFATRARGVGYASASEEDGKSATCEIWAPIWTRPASLRELRYLMAEGRAYIGRDVPQHSLQFAVALANLGVDRGLNGFVRYGMLVRRGDSKVMMPLGRFEVKHVQRAHLLEEMTKALEPVDRYMGQNKGSVPASLSSARRSVDQATYDVVAYGSPNAFKELLRAIGRLEEVIVRTESYASKLPRPIGGLSPEWLLACDDGSPEVRLAGSISSIYDEGLGPWRAHMAPVDPKRPDSWAQGWGHVSWGQGDVYKNLATAIHKRVLLASSYEGSDPLKASVRLHPADVMPLVTGRVDERALTELLRGMSWINWGSRSSFASVKEVREAWKEPLDRRAVPRGWTLLAATLHPDALKDAEGDPVTIRPKADLIALLEAERYFEAVRTARRRLFAEGVPLRSAMPEESLRGIMVAASLAVPVCLNKVVNDVIMRKDER